MMYDLSSEFCPFCDKVANGSAEKAGRFSTVYTFEPLNPVTEGHRLFIPRNHVEEGDFIAPTTIGSIFSMAAIHASKQKEDYNLIINVGKDASQTIPHLHAHYVPRRPQDGLHLPWTAK